MIMTVPISPGPRYGRQSLKQARNTAITAKTNDLPPRRPILPSASVIPDVVPSVPRWRLGSSATSPEPNVQTDCPLWAAALVLDRKKLVAFSAAAGRFLQFPIGDRFLMSSDIDSSTESIFSSRIVYSPTANGSPLRGLPGHSGNSNRGGRPTGVHRAVPPD